MKKVLLLFCGMLFATAVFGENFPNDFQAALKLVNEGKTAEAEEAFLKLAGQKAGKRATNESLAQARYRAAAGIDKAPADVREGARKKVEELEQNPIGK